jgi:hypothetical protein
MEEGGTTTRTGTGAGEEEEEQQHGYTKKTKHQVQIVLAEMEHQICEGKTDREIMDFLDMKRRSYYYFKS